MDNYLQDFSNLIHLVKLAFGYNVIPLTIKHLDVLRCYIVEKCKLIHIINGTLGNKESADNLKSMSVTTLKKFIRTQSTTKKSCRFSTVRDVNRSF